MNYSVVIAARFSFDILNYKNGSIFYFVDIDALRASPIGTLMPIRGNDVRLDNSYDTFAYIPNPLPSEFQLSQRTYKLMTEADRALGALNARVGLLPNPNLLVRPAIRKEAQATSALEGTYAPLEDVFENDYSSKPQSAEMREIFNYIQASDNALEMISTLPIGVRLLTQLQETLVTGTRGHNADAGRLREVQVVIGNHGEAIDQARFIPPPPGQPLIDGMSDWEKWINAEDDIPLLAKVAIAHYQFETLHPFSDGNGRLGRLVITLQLLDAGVLEYPVLNLSPWFEPRRERYVEGLRNLSRTGDFDAWVAFFVEGVKDRAEFTLRAINSLLEFRDATMARVRSLGATNTAIEAVGDLIGYPVLSIADIQVLRGVTYPTAKRAVDDLVRYGVLQRIGSGNYGKVYRCAEVSRILVAA